MRSYFTCAHLRFAAKMKTATLFVLLFTGVLAVAHGRGDAQLMCLQGQVQQCAALLRLAVDTGAVSLDSFCNKLDELNECFNAARKTCNDDGAGYLYDFLNVLKDICQPGTDLHRKFTKNSECLMNYPNPYLASSTCLDEIQEAAKSLLEPTQEKIKEFSRKTCEIFPKILHCVYRDVNRRCSSDARDVVEAVFEPMSKLTRKNCIEAGFSVGGAGTSALSRILLAAASLLLILWHRM